MDTNPADINVNDTAPRSGMCQSCGCTGIFTFAGTQHIPPRVAQKMNISISQFNLWHCPNCGTTLSDITLGNISLG